MEKSAISEIQQATNASIKTETGTSSENENQDERLVSAISEMFKELKPSVSNKCRLYKVPYHLRTLNPKVYTPHVISIGPYHHNNENCRTMEKHKVRYFQNFKERVETKGLKMENLVSTIREMENEIRSCYVETVQLKSDDFVKMIMLDASFILELFLRNMDGLKDDDPMRMEAWLFSMVYHNLLLLENQLPFFVLEELYHLALPPSLSYPISLIQLTFHFFKYFNIQNKSPDNVEIQHFTDLLRFFQLPPTNKLPERVEKAVFPKYSITQLHEAGVRFVAPSKCVPDEVALSIRDEKPSSKCLLDEVVLDACVLGLKFKRGVLEIPHLKFQDDTETLVRNIIALEQCDDGRGAYITDFYLILDRLINSTKDVDLLGDEGILINGLGDNSAVTSMIHNLNRGIFYANMNPGFCQLSDDLNKYYERSWHRWKARVKKQYPTMAILGLVLTLIQTVLSILQK